MPLPSPSDATALASVFAVQRDFSSRIKFGTWDVTLPAGSAGTGNWTRNFAAAYPAGSTPQVLIGIKSATSGGSAYFTGAATATLTGANFSITHRTGATNGTDITFTVSHIAIG